MSDELPDLSKYIPEGWTGIYPPCQIQVSPEGQMSSAGRPMVHPTIIKLIHDSVRLQDGHYVVTIDGKSCELEVADTFFVVSRVVFGGDGATVTLNDGTSEALDPATLKLGDNEIIYCAVKNGGFPARFLRQAYYQRAEKIVEQDDGFALELGGRIWPLGGAA